MILQEKKSSIQVFSAVPYLCLGSCTEVSHFDRMGHILQQFDIFIINHHITQQNKHMNAICILDFTLQVTNLGINYNVILHIKVIIVLIFSRLLTPMYFVLFKGKSSTEFDNKTSRFSNQKTKRNIFQNIYQKIFEIHIE